MLQAEWYGARDFVPPLDSTMGVPLGGTGGIRRGLPLEYTPILFIHGTTHDAHDWDANIAKFKEKGYIDQELWAVSYNGSRFPGALATHKDNAVDIEHFVQAMLEYLGPVPKIDIVAHSMGVTLARYWLQTYNRYHTVRRCIFIAGGNHGLHLDKLSVKMTGQAGRELVAGSLFLRDLNRDGENPCQFGVERCAVIWDGTGDDMVFGREIDYHSPTIQKKPSASRATYKNIDQECVTHIQRPGLSHMRLIGETAEEQYQFLTAE